MKKLRIGTRGSTLALKQAKMLEEALTVYPELETEIVVMKTQGDKILDKPLLDFGGKGVFVTEFEEAILNGKIDVAVHSAKDMPMELADGLCVGAVLRRDDVSDVLLFSETGRLKYRNGEETVVGTGSLRRRCQLEKLYPYMKFKSIRGNVPTRMKKVMEGECDGIVLAYAGLQRLGLLEEEDFYYEKLSVNQMLPAAGQGIIAIECKKESECEGLLQKISDTETMYALETERQVIRSLNAGCNDAVGAYAKVEQERIQLDIFRYENNEIIRKSGTTDIANRCDLARALVSQWTNGR